jgi:UDP:flavonoid glycosyltransferase YjiC (YdhE family)
MGIEYRYIAFTPQLLPSGWHPFPAFKHQGFPKYPHLKLFPNMAAVIHHGGAGTTATTAISGVPQIIVPHLLDQYYWGNQIYQSNLGPRPIWRSELTSKRLAATIRECLSNDRIRQKAKEASVIIKQQDSLEFTVSEILRSLSN